MIEVEKRTFITKEKYEELLKKYSKTEESKKQITTYYDCEQDFRMMETNEYTQLWLKGGRIHDDYREESVVKIDNKYRNDLIKMLTSLGYKTEIIWYRTRNTCKYGDLELCIDYTEGYGYIFEVEKCVEKEEEIEKANSDIQNFFKENNIDICDKKIFKEKYEEYKLNWKELTKNVDKAKYI